MTVLRWLDILLFLLLAMILQGQSVSNVTVVKLSCENMINPQGIETLQPRLSWRLQSDLRNVHQSAYRILVSDDPKKLNTNTGNIWDSKRLNTDQSLWINYNGIALKPAKYYYWKIMVWDVSGKPSSWSETSRWQMGLLHPENWSNAKWIGYDELDESKRIVPGIESPADKPQYKNLITGKHILPLIRKKFSLGKTVSRATAFISGLGHYELYINGTKIGDRFIAPGWTNYNKYSLYNTFDVTRQIMKGDNAIGIMLGNGFYNIPNDRYRKLITAFGNPTTIVKLLVEYTDGTTAEVISDDSWKVHPGPVTYSSIFGGEDYDSNLEQKDWSMPSFNDAPWKKASVVKPPTNKLVAESDHPVKIMKSIPVESIIKLSDTSYLYDFGQNASGIIRLKVKGKKGQTLRLYPGELIDKNKKANQRASGGPYYFSYTLKGDNMEEWEPRFTYYGFRYVEVIDAIPDTASNKVLPAIVDMQLLHTHNSSPRIGNFSNSSDHFNKTYNLIDWAVRSNLQSVVTDCPHREKLGWLEQTYLMGESIHYNYDIYGLYKKLVTDMSGDQTAAGLVPDITPEYVQFCCGFRDSPEWGSAGVILPWLIYKWYGDTTVMRQAWPMMKKYVQYLGTKANDHILSHGLGDWYDLGPKFPGVAQLTPLPLTATAIYYYDIALLSRMAVILNNRTEADQLNILGDSVKTAFNKKFFNPQTKVYSTGSQTAISMPLCVGLVDEKNRKDVFATLLRSIDTSGKALTAGDVGFHFVVQALSDGGGSQVLYEMNARNDVPGYGFQLKKGATALTESWAALEEVSNNHLMLGHIMEWFYNGLAGIRQSENSTAYKQIEIKPQPVEGITAAKASFESPFGIISSDWKKNGTEFSIAVTIPPNTTAVIYLPATASSVITEMGKPLTASREVKSLGFKDGKAMLQVGSGKYHFVVK